MGLEPRAVFLKVRVEELRREPGGLAGCVKENLKETERIPAKRTTGD